MASRKVAIQLIVADVAETGIAGKFAIRAYIESRMSRQTFDEACAIGQAIYRRKHAIEACAPKGYFSKVSG